MEYENQVAVKFDEAIITIENKKEIENMITDVAERYAGIVVTEDTLKDGRAVRRTLNTFLGNVEDQRKAIKKVFNEPLKQFEEWVRDAEKPLKETINSIDYGIKELETKQKAERFEVFKSYVAFKAIELDVEYPSESVISDWFETFSAKSNYKASGDMTNKAESNLDSVMAHYKLEQESIETDLKYIKSISDPAQYAALEKVYYTSGLKEVENIIQQAGEKEVKQEVQESEKEVTTRILFKLKSKSDRKKLDDLLKSSGLDWKEI